MSFSVGDVVVLKSGGPEMTITKVTGGDYIACTWFTDGKPESFSFPAGALETYVEEVPDFSQFGAS